MPCRGAVKTYKKPRSSPCWETAAAEWTVVLELDVSVRGSDFLYLGPPDLINQVIGCR